MNLDSLTRRHSSPRWRSVLTALLVAAFAAGCGDAATPSNGSTTPDVAVDVADIADVLVEDTPDVSADAAEDAGSDGDVAVLPDVAKPDAGDGSSECPGGPGCACTKNSDCASEYCLDTADGQVCAKKCADGVCPTDFKCGSVSASGGDLINVCVPVAPYLCNPCTANTQCQSPGNSGAKCVDNGAAGAFCGIACSADGDCPTGYNCQDVKDLTGGATKQCVVKNGGACTCNAGAIKNGAYTWCSKSVGESKCKGKRVCSASGLSDCQAEDPQAEKCDGLDNDCDGQTDEAACDDGNPCTDDACDPKAGCSYTNNSAFCDNDGSVCTKDDACVDGKCLTGKPLKCDDNNPCTTDECDVKTGCKYTNADGLGCNFDDNPCTVGDACKDGQCVAGPKKACSTEEPCIVGKCDLFNNGACKYDVKDAQPCDDGNPCTIADTCAKDVCAGKVNDCDDGNSCTTDACDNKVGCSHVNSVGKCDDGDKCTTADACASGTCSGVVVAAAVLCDDKNPCTTDTCSPLFGCQNKAQVGAACDDGNACSTGDKCDALGQCAAGENTCACSNDSDCALKDDGNACNGVLFCDKSGALSQCKIKPGSVPAPCDTSTDSFCKKTQCNPQTGYCEVTAQSTGQACDDGNFCTTGDVCAGYGCKPGSPVDCDDKNPCTADTCDKLIGCLYTNLDTPCDADGDACTQNDTCNKVTGKCTAGVAKVCNDNEFCTDDSCDKVTGSCVNKQVAKSCSDSNECTVGDACGLDGTGKYTCLAGKGQACDDNNPCTKDTCDPSKVGGCANVVDATVQVQCYGGDPKYKGIGECKLGTQQCNALGQLGPCLGYGLPAQDVCDGKDNDCNGVADPGCAPKDWGYRSANVRLAGQTNLYSVNAVGGASQVGGPAASLKWLANFGFQQWLKAWFVK